MSDYELYYSLISFRGQFVRAVLAYAGKELDRGRQRRHLEADGRGGDGSCRSLSWGRPSSSTKRRTSPSPRCRQLSSISARPWSSMPAAPALRAMTIKIVNDANDVLDEITLDGGRQMWRPTRWEDFVPRLKKWMSFWGGDRPPPRPEGGLRLPARRRVAWHRRRGYSHPMVDHRRPVHRDRTILEKRRP